MFKAIVNFLEAVGKAKYAAHLSRQGKWKEAQEMYTK